MSPSNASVGWYLGHGSQLLAASRSPLSNPTAVVAGNSPPTTGQSGTEPSPPSGSIQPAFLIGPVASVPSGPTAAQEVLSGAEDPYGTTLSVADRTSAQTVPALPYLSLFGSLNSADPSKVFDIPRDRNTRVAAIELLLASAGNIPLEMTVYNASGAEIADLPLFPGSGPPVLSLTVPENPARLTPGVYVKVAASAGLEGSTTPFSGPATNTFDLQVTQGPAAFSPVSRSPIPQAHAGDDSSPLPNPARNVAPEATFAYAEVPSFGPQALDGERGSSAFASSAPAPPGQQQQPGSFVVATGPLPERAGAPLGGVLAEGDPVPQVDRHAPALVDLLLIGLPEPEALPVLAEGDPRAMAQKRAPASSVAKGLFPVRGPGGSPLLVSAQPGERRPNIDALLAALPPARAATAQIGSAVSVAPTDTPPEPVAATRPRRVFSVAALFGVTAAMTMVFGAVLPDMSRMMTVIDSSRFPLRPLRRSTPEEALNRGEKAR